MHVLNLTRVGETVSEQLLINTKIYDFPYTCLNVTYQKYRDEDAKILYIGVIGILLWIVTIGYTIDHIPFGNIFA